MKVLVTGIAGFIGAHVAERLIAQGHEVVGFDNINSYYDPALKRARIAHFFPQVQLYEYDLADRSLVAKVFAEHSFDRVCHLGAQAGVRYSIQDPWTYAASNYDGTLNIFEQAHRSGNIPVVYASTSSVYGASKLMPFTEEDRCDTPLSVYAATKRGTELLAHTYADMYGMALTGLRFFTVYGPWGRPDLSLFLFTKAALEGTTAKLFNGGNMRRDFTYIDDIVQGVTLALAAPKGNKVYNIGRGAPVGLKEFVVEVEKATGKTLQYESAPMQPGDVPETFADISRARAELGYEPKVDVPEGVRRFVDWYRAYYNV